MQIANFTNTYLPVINGVARSVSAYRKALTELCHNVFVFTMDAEGYQDEEPFIFRYPTLKLSYPVKFPAVIPISPFADNLLPYLKLDVIHTHHPFLLGQTAASKAKELSLPLVFTFHTQYREYSHYVPLPQDVFQDFIKDAIENWLGEFMQKCQHIIVPTHSMRHILADTYGLEERVTVIPTGIDLRRFANANGEAVRAEQTWGEDTVLISAGRLAQEKNWETLLKAGALAMRTHPELRIVILGDGPQREDLQAFAQEAGIAERVTFLGEVPFEEVPAYLKAADLFGFASVTETQGLVTVEAMAAGLPVAAVDAVGTRDAVEDEKQGWLTENDSQALAEAILRLLENPDARQAFSQAALERAQTFDIQILAKHMLGVYQQAIEDKLAGLNVCVPRHNQLT